MGRRSGRYSGPAWITYNFAVFAALDVYYRDGDAVAACVLFRTWADAAPAREVVEPCPGVEPYRPGEFFRRELPCLLRCIARIDEPLEAIVIDGYVWLEDGAPALGGHLYRALGERVPVVGVAKSRFGKAGPFVEVTRGASLRPLFVSAAGLELALAAEHVRSMHGAFRMPTLLKRVDRLCRSEART